MTSAIAGVLGAGTLILVVGYVIDRSESRAVALRSEVLNSKDTEILDEFKQNTNTLGDLTTRLQAITTARRALAAARATLNTDIQDAAAAGRTDPELAARKTALDAESAKLNAATDVIKTERTALDGAAKQVTAKTAAVSRERETVVAAQAQIDRRELWTLLYALAAMLLSAPLGYWYTTRRPSIGT